jgi:hypothetical protein
LEKLAPLGGDKTVGLLTNVVNISTNLVKIALDKWQNSILPFIKNKLAKK